TQTSNGSTTSRTSSPPLAGDWWPWAGSGSTSPGASTRACTAGAARTWTSRYAPGSAVARSCGRRAAASPTCGAPRTAAPRRTTALRRGRPTIVAAWWRRGSGPSGRSPGVPQSMRRPCRIMPASKRGCIAGPSATSSTASGSSTSRGAFWRGSPFSFKRYLLVFACRRKSWAPLPAH
ncbi:unnamed protein product, partial [Effrenium voratum]